jgi:hypothetical protein
MKSTFARTSGGMTCSRSTAITFLSLLFARPAQFFNRSQHAQMFSRAFFEAQLQIYPQQTAIDVLHQSAHGVGACSY